MRHRSTSETVEIEVFVTDLMPNVDPVDRVTVGEHVLHGYRAMRDGAREIHAAPGFRLGEVAASTTTRQGDGCEIVRSMMVDPWTASTIAVSGAFRHRPHRFLTFVDPTPEDDRALAWTVVIAAPRMRAIPATLHLRAAPSMVVSVLELVPRRTLHWRRARFVDVGIEAIDSLAHDFEAVTAVASR